MRRTPGLGLAAYAGVAVLLGATAACGETEAGGASRQARSSPSAESSHHRFDDEVQWAEGRRVGMYYAARRGLMEQHQVTAGGAWSKPRQLYATKTDACQSITLKAFADGTVAAIADWGPYCHDGEPPMESIAAVGTGNLSTWDTKLEKSFDGWEKVEASDGTDRLTFTNSGTEWLTRLRWSRADGFAEVEDIRR